MRFRLSRSACDRPLDVLVSAVVGLDAAGDLDERGESCLVQTGHIASVRVDLHAGPCRRPAAFGMYSTSFMLTVRRTTSPVTLLSRNWSGVTSPPTTPRPSPQLAFDRHHARVAAHRVAGEEHAGHLGVDHHLHGDAHRRLLSGATLGAVADRTGRVEARPAIADRVERLLETAHPEEALLLAGERRLLAVLPEGARADRDRRCRGTALAHELVVDARRAPCGQRPARWRRASPHRSPSMRQRPPPRRRSRRWRPRSRSCPRRRLLRRRRGIR